MNFFQWIRDGVRRAVLLGVSDAVTDLGTPEGGEEQTPPWLEVIRSNPPALTQETPSEPNRRRKLGRSLQEMQPATK